MSRTLVDSGIKWIGNIPDDWSIVQVKQLFNIGRGRVISQEELLDDGIYPVYSSQTKDNGCLGYIKTYDFDRTQITWTTDGANAGTIFLRTGKHNCTNVCGTLCLKDILLNNYNYSYLKYILDHTCYYHKRADTNGFKIMNNEMANIRICIPQLEEQIKIANYLDDKCSKIDKVIEDNNKEIELLEEYKKSVISKVIFGGTRNHSFKNSKVSEFGSIPDSWNEASMRSMFNFRKGLSITKEDLIDNGAPVISYGQIHAKCNTGIGVKEELIRYVSDQYLENSSKSLAYKNDIIFADTSEDLDGVGNCVYIDTSEPIFAGYHTFFAHPVTDITKYYAYLFQTDKWRSQLRKSVYGVKLFSITQRLIKGCTILVPSIEEQLEIVAYLDNMCPKIDKVIEYRKKIIEKLEEYKKSLIYEVVTGKKEV